MPLRFGNPRLVQLVFAAGAILFAGFLFRASGTPGNELPSGFPGPTGNLMHVLLHAILALLVLRALVPHSKGSLDAWPGARSSSGVIVLGLVALHGIVDETHQFFVPGRTCSLIDVGLDIAGALLVLLIPIPRGRGRPDRWVPFITVLGLAVLLAWLGWWSRPFPDRALEVAIAALLGPAQK